MNWQHHIKIVGYVFVTIAAVFWANPSEATWEKMDPPPSAEAAIDLASCPGKSECFYVATPHQVFRNEKNIWQLLFTFSAPGDSIVRLRIFPSSPFLWIQTQKNIFALNPLSDKTEKIYGVNDPGKFPISFWAEATEFWVGTVSGLWNSKDHGKTWQKNTEPSNNKPISLIVKTTDGFFFASNGSWIKSEDKNSRGVLRLFNFEEHVEFSDLDLSQNNLESSAAPMPISFFDFLSKEKTLYLATLKGVFKSSDGLQWLQLPNSGLRITKISRLSWDEKNNCLLAATSQGVFNFDEKNQHWKSQSEGLAKLGIRAILFSSQKLIVSTAEGLWTEKESVFKDVVVPEKALLFNQLILLEPSAREIHKHVVRCSDTSAGKIKRWHTESRLAALLPNLSLSKSISDSNNIDIDRGGTNDPDRFVEGPHDEDRDLGLDVSWDLGNMIFSSSQTSIDSRSKLMVDLRNDLLSEATRLFYERKRLQAETIRSPALDEKTHFDRLLRIDEVTSLLDTLTDGFLSERLEKIYKQHPELEALWTFKELKT